MANGWTPERRARQAELIRAWKPWERSTGPRSEAGKQVSAQRGFRGAVREQARIVAAALKEQREVLESLG